ncbi:MAG TPA: cytochrome c maturation protein CcmE [Acidimicrobiales bacterium]|nr:cytochrome c maturation protein CcmE [Acidimicrobiales bacterium]
MTTAAPPATPVRPRGQANRKRLWIAGAVILLALGFLVVQALGEATVYFKTADEAVAEKDGLGDRRFRIEGLVVAGSVKPAPAGDGVDFEIRGQRGATVDVIHRGDPPELFKPGIPVVLEGRWSGDHYASDRIMVKHTNEYKAENPDRVDDYVGQNR